MVPGSAACPLHQGKGLNKTVTSVKMLFLGAFTKLQKATLSFVLSGCPSICPHGTTRHPLDGFWWNLTFEGFRKSVEKKQVSLKSGKNNGYLTWIPIYIFDHISLSSLEWTMFLTKVVEKIKTHFVLNPPPPPKKKKSFPVWDNVEKCGRARQATDDSIITAHALCMLGN
jgi:hypothetical protein